MAKKEINKVGRPNKEFTDEEIAIAEDMAYHMCQNHTIAVKLGCDDETVVKYLSPKLQLKRAEYKYDLRKQQIQQSKKNPIMSIFLGKNYVDQADKQEISGKDGAPLLAPQINVMAPEPKPGSGEGSGVVKP